ncbi:hypothetical protein [Methylocystis parvus]|uniref:hypothetical protein n=1 Tax=Methylocystis parvus TaxID=134 RepID=UPI003C779142
MRDRLVFCVGLYRSASTWVFNVCREIYARQGTPFSSLYADDPRPALLESVAAADVCVVKSHIPDEAFQLIMAAYDPPAIVSIRDPRDCVASLMTQFGVAFEPALEMVEKSAGAMAAMPLMRGALVLKYESPGWRGAEGVLRIAGALNARISRGDAEEIAEKLSVGAVEAFLQQLDEAQYFDRSAAASGQFHKETHFHPNHVGDGRTGKFKAILTRCQERLTVAATQGFCRRFGYDIPLPPVDFGENVLFADSGRVYLSNGFSAPERWGVWTLGFKCEISLPLPRKAERVIVHIRCLYGPAFRHGEPGRVASIFINDALAMEIAQNPDTPERDVLTLRCETGEVDRLRITFTFDQILTAIDIGLNDSDDRPVGMGLCAVRVEADD